MHLSHRFVIRIVLLAVATAVPVAASAQGTAASPQSVAASSLAPGSIRQFTERAIVRTPSRQSDSLLNGALIGAGAGIASGLLLCTRTEPFRNCVDDAGPMIRIGAIGAGIGIAIDALIRRRDPGERRTSDSARWFVTPAVGRGTGAVGVSIRY